MFQERKFQSNIPMKTKKDECKEVMIDIKMQICQYHWCLRLHVKIDVGSETIDVIVRHALVLLMSCRLPSFRILPRTPPVI